MNMSSKPQFAIVFDTNSYRSFTFGKSILDIISEVNNLAKKESSNGVLAFANPFVMLELASHLADPTDPAYNNCLGSIIALSLHCAHQPKQIAVLADSESQLCWALHRKVPATHQDTTEKLCRLFNYISTHCSESDIAKIRNDLKEITGVVSDTEARFISDMMQFTVQGFDPEATDWSPLRNDATLRKKVLTFIDSQDSLLALCRVHVFKSYFLLGESIDETQVDTLSKLLLMNFEAPFQLYREIVRRIIMTGCNLSKKNRANWVWDIQIAFTIGPNHNLNGLSVRLVTEDGDILEAAKKANCESMVCSLREYLSRINGTSIKL